MATLGFGGAGVGNLYRALSEDAAQEVLESAWAAGFRQFDTAPLYGFGLSERRLGAGLRGRPAVISTKVGRVLEPIEDAPRSRQGFIDGDPYRPVFDYGGDAVLRAFEGSVKRLEGLSIGDLNAHDLGRVTHGDEHDRHLRAFLDGGYPTMAALRDQGAVQRIGLAVNEWGVVEQVLAHVDLDTVLLAGRYTLLEQGALDGLDRCFKRGVRVVIGGAFNSGLLARSPGGAKPTTYNYQPASADLLDRVDRLEAICARHGTPLAAAALHFPSFHPAVERVLVGLSSVEEVHAAAVWRDWPIPVDLWAELRAEGAIRADAPAPDRDPD